MGLFSKKPSDSKARIEELKKKIQAEQAAFTAEAPQAAPAPAAPAPAPAPVPQPVYQQPPPRPAPVYAPPPQPVYQQPQYENYAPPAPQTHRMDEELFDSMEEIKTGIILDLGDGMSLNLPIRSKMRLDEFLHIADRVRELQRLQRMPH